eukprot:5364837-Alexandrium_andersonii.AAC.1
MSAHDTRCGALFSALEAAAPADAGPHREGAPSGPSMSQLKPSSWGAQAALPSSQCKFTNCKWRSIRSPLTALVRVSAGFFSPGHLIRAESPERTRSCTHS